MYIYICICICTSNLYISISISISNIYILSSIMWFPAFCFFPVSPPPRSEDKELELFAEETPNVAPNTAPGCLWLGAMSRILSGSSHLVSELPSGYLYHIESYS